MRIEKKRQTFGQVIFEFVSIAVYFVKCGGLFSAGFLFSECANDEFTALIF
jgi:hypothetical protein